MAARRSLSTNKGVRHTKRLRRTAPMSCSSYRPLMRGVILDLGGTVVDFGARAAKNALRESFALQHNVILPDRLLRASAGRSARDHVRDIFLSARDHCGDEMVAEAVSGEAPSLRSELFQAGQRHVRLGDAIWGPLAASELCKEGRPAPSLRAAPQLRLGGDGEAAPTPTCVNDLTDALHAGLRERLPDWVAHYNHWTSPRVPGVLRELRAAGVRVAFCTEYSRDAAAPFARLLEASFGGDHGMPVVTADDVRCGRPGPEMSLRAAELLGLDPAGCLRVGDTVMDMAEGSAAGMRAVGILDCGNEVGLPRDAFRALDPAERDRMRSWASQTLTCAGATATISSLAALEWFL